MNNWVTYAIVTLFLIVIPLVPTLLRLRLKLFKWLGWNWAAELLEDHFERWVLFARVVLLMAAVVVVVLLD